MRTTRRSGLAAEPSGGLSWKGTRTGRQVSPVRSPRPSARAASPPYLIFPRAEIATRQRHTRDCSTPTVAYLHSIAPYDSCAARGRCKRLRIVDRRPSTLSSLVASFFTVGIPPLTVSCHLRSPSVARTWPRRTHVVCHMAPVLHWLRALVVVVGIYYTCGCDPRTPTKEPCPAKCGSCTTG